MKFCRRCGVEISTPDGVNFCDSCQSMSDRQDKLAKRKRQQARARRRERAEVMRSLGLKRVRGALGGEYWE